MAFTFGKYKGKTVEEVLDTDVNYCKWATSQPYLAEDIKSIINEYMEKHDDSGYRMKWGKYKNKTLTDIKELDPFYLTWLKCNEFAKKDSRLMDELLTEV